MEFYFKEKKIHYQVIGQGPAVVFLHGFLESSDMWNPVLEDLQERRQLILLDLPGFGKSEPLEELHSMSLMAEVVYALLEQLKVASISLVGHSMGGYISLAFVEKYPEKVDQIIMMNSTYASDSEERKAIRDRSVRLMQENPRAFIGMAIGNWAVASSRDTHKKAIQELKDRAYDFPIEGIIAALKGMRNRKERYDILQQFPKPKFLLLAEDDPIIPCQETKEGAEAAGVEVRVVSGGHMSMIENEVETRAFLKSILT